MKKLFISVVIALMCILTIFTIFRGIHIGGFKILGLSEIKAEDKELEEKVTEATRLASTDYPNQLANIKKDMQDMESEKQQYEDMVAVSSDSEISASVQKQKYTIDKLWTKIGRLATDEGLDAKFVLTNGSLQAAKDEDFNYYTIEFEVTGSYVGVALYLSSLEDDSELGFRIQDFKMVPATKKEQNEEQKVIATFKTEDVAIQGILKEEPKEEDTEDADKDTKDKDTKEDGAGTKIEDYLEEDEE